MCVYIYMANIKIAYNKINFANLYENLKFNKMFTYFPFVSSSDIDIYKRCSKYLFFIIALKLFYL